MCFSMRSMSVDRSRSPSIYPSPFTPQNAIRIGRTLARGARNLYDRYRSSSRGRSMSRGTSTDRSSTPQIYGGSATKPYTSQYRRRRRSRRVRRKAKKYYKAFRKTFRKISGVALQKVIFNGSVSATALPIAQQWLATHLFSYNSAATVTQETGVRDMLQLVNNLTNATLADDFDNSSRRMIEYGIIDITLHNIGAAKAEVDMYHICYNDDKLYTSLANLFGNANAVQSSSTTTAADRITINDRGATLFDLNQFLSLGAVKVLSKEKMFMSTGDVYNFQYKVKKLKCLTNNEVVQSENGHLAEKSMTHTWVVVFKSVTGDTNTAALQMASTRSYGYRIDGVNQQTTSKLPE